LSREQKDQGNANISVNPDLFDQVSIHYDQGIGQVGTVSSTVLLFLVK
jgi:hypothetical protein